MRILIVLLFIISCGSYTPKPVIKHVLAVTSEGDTLLIPLNRIRPNVYQTIYPSYGNIYDSYYYNGWKYNTNVYSNHKTYSGNINNKSKDISRLDIDKKEIKQHKEFK